MLRPPDRCIFYVHICINNIYFKRLRVVHTRFCFVFQKLIHFSVKSFASYFFALSFYYYGNFPFRRIILLNRIVIQVTREVYIFHAYKKDRRADGNNDSAAGRAKTKIDVHVRTFNPFELNRTTRIRIWRIGRGGGAWSGFIRRR